MCATKQRRQWHPTPVLLPGKSHGRRSLVGYSPWGRSSWTRLSDFAFTFHFHALEKEMATHSSVLAWRIPGTGEPGGLPSMGSHRVGHDWETSLSLFTFMHWRRKWQPTPKKKKKRIPWAQEPGGLQPMGLQRVWHDCLISLCACFPADLHLSLKVIIPRKTSWS